MGTPILKTETHPQPTPGERDTLADRRKKQLEVKSPHVDIDELHSADGLFSVISQRRSNGGYTFAVFKSFQRAGETHRERTSFIPEEMGESYIALVKLTLERIDQLRASGTSPFHERERA